MWLLLIASLLLVYIFFALIGSHECFQGTFVENIQYYITDGVCDFLGYVFLPFHQQITVYILYTLPLSAHRYAIVKVFGPKGTHMLESTEAACCQGRNPIGQFFFIIMFTTCFVGICMDVFPRLPLPGVPYFHVYTGTMAAIACFSLFLFVSYSDPGIIQQQDIDAHCALYPDDDIIFQSNRYCTTCACRRPARAKHCNATKACIARFDHWCIWVNNSIGLYNTRWFLLFLLIITVVCLYGSIICVKVIFGDIATKNIWSRTWLDPKTGKHIKIQDDWGLLSQYIIATYGTLAGLAVFLCMAAWIIFGFTAYQCYRIGIGITTNESWKRKEIERMSATISDSIQSKYNAYNRGWRGNFEEILFPRRVLRRALREKRKSR